MHIPGQNITCLPVGVDLSVAIWPAFPPLLKEELLLAHLLDHVLIVFNLVLLYVDSVCPCLFLFMFLTLGTGLVFIWAVFKGRIPIIATDPTQYLSSSALGCLGILLAWLRRILCTFACFVSCSEAVCIVCSCGLVTH